MNTASSIQATTAPLEDPIKDLGDDSYTLHRLRHCTPEHLHLTTRRCFIGPIPEGWLKSHRRHWYTHHLNLHYSSRSPSFNASSEQGRQRRLTGLDGPSVLASKGRLAFSQPDDVNEAIEEEEEEDDDGPLQPEAANDGDEDTPATLDDPPAIVIPRAHALKNGTTEEEVLNQGHEPASIPADSLSPPRPIFSQRKSSSSRPNLNRSTSGLSFHTAHEDSEPVEESAERPESSLGADSPARNDSQITQSAGYSGLGNISDVEHSSRSSLLKHNNDATDIAPIKSSSNADSKPKQALKRIKSSMKTTNDRSQEQERSQSEDQIAKQQDINNKTASGLVRFNIPADQAQQQRHMKVRVAQLRQRRTFKRIQRGTVHDGEIIKMENMLVRVEFTAHEMPRDFNENDSAAIESRLVEKWKEYLVVCRETTDEETPFILQMYKSRVIPSVDYRGKKKYTHEIPLKKQTTNTSLYSSLDKTICISVPRRKGTLIYILQARAGANSMEWYTFLRNVLGWKRTAMLTVRIPDLDMSLRLDKPFESIETSAAAAQDEDAGEDAIAKTMREEQAVSGRIVQRCLEMLMQSPELSPIIDEWAGGERIGLAWKRYDRLEWVHGANEKKMYGTIAMEKSHDLELRPKHHYPTLISPKGEEAMTEPPPVEGFLIRLTSQRGFDHKFGRLFFKRLYFSTHNQFLAFNRPARADPPPPPRMPMQTTNQIPTAHQIAEKLPLIYSVNPYPIKDGKITWLLQDSTDPITRQQRDCDAFDEDERKTNLLLQCDGILDMCNIVTVRKVKRGATPADENVESGSDVDFDASVPDSHRDDGVTQEFDDERTFELVLRSGAIVRLQAFDKVTAHEWRHRLRGLVNYWKRRIAADVNEYKAVRRTNLARLNIDEEAEAAIDHSAEKWQVARAVASPQLYHMCGISACRAIHLAGSIYRKTRMHGPFSRILAVLAHGSLMMFEDLAGAPSVPIEQRDLHDRVAALDLRECYVYSGALVDADLPSSSKQETFDAGRGTLRALPRRFAEDGWTSCDEDYMTCFVVWHGRRKTLFRKEVDGNAHHRRTGTQSDRDDGRLGSTPGGVGRHKVIKKVSSLGVQGRSIVFKTRSRAERDHWVMSVALEIERLSAGSGDDVRLTE